MKKVLIGLISILVLLIIIMTWYRYTSKIIHKPINVNDVSRIELWGETQMKRVATKEEIENITKWFNSATDIRQNKEFAGTTPHAGIIIELKNRNTILVLRSGTDFEIQRDYVERRVSYWAKQPDIKKLLDQLLKAE